MLLYHSVALSFCQSIVPSLYLSFCCCIHRSVSLSRSLHHFFTFSIILLLYLLFCGYIALSVALTLSWCQRASNHNTFTQFSSESLVNFRRACTCAFLSRGTLQDFSPSWCSVLPIVFLVTLVPAALRSLTRSSRVVLGWFLTVLMIIETPRGEILHGAPVRGRLTVILCFFYLRIITPTVVTFSPSCLVMVL